MLRHCWFWIASRLAFEPGACGERTRSREEAQTLMASGSGKPYGRSFYDRHVAGATNSAAVIVPILVETLRPRRVVDVGCGVGAWLAAFHRQGADRILGLDGDHVPHDRLLIAPEHFRPTDLRQPFHLDERFDLVISTEVAEHLPQGAAAGFVTALTTLGDIVFFSAAIPRQGGDHHVNEQWQSYWAALFATQGYRPIDCIRPRVWDNPAVGWWYAQNSLLYASPAAIARSTALRDLLQQSAGRPLDIVHPRRFLLDDNPEEISVRRAWRVLRAALQHRIAQQLSR